MINRTKRIQSYIAHELLLAYKNDKVTLRLYDILVKVANRYKFALFEMDNSRTGFNLNGCYSDGYWILLDTLSIIQKMIDTGIIYYFEQGDVLRAFPEEGIGNEGRGYDQLAKITGSFANYIYVNLWKSIWISSDIENFAKNGFVPEELSLAREQTKDAKCTLKWAIATFVITAMSTIFNLIQVDAECGVTIHFCPLVMTILIIMFCIFITSAFPSIRRMMCNCHRHRR